MSDSNLSPVAGSRVKSSATDLDSRGRKKSTGCPTEPNAGNGKRYGCVVPRRLGLPVTARLHVCCGETIFDPVPKRAMQMRVPWRPSVGVGTVEDAVWGLLGAKSPVEPPRRRAGQGCVGRRMPKSHPTSTTYVIASLGFLCDPLSAWAAPLPSSAVATRGRGSSLSPALPPWTPASRKEERDTWDMGVLLRFRTEGQRARGLRHGAMGQSLKKKKPRGVDKCTSEGITTTRADTIKSPVQL